MYKAEIMLIMFFFMTPVIIALWNWKKTIPSAMFIKKVLLGKYTGVSFVDSAVPLHICKNQRIHMHNFLYHAQVTLGENCQYFRFCAPTHRRWCTSVGMHGALLYELPPFHIPFLPTRVFLIFSAILE